MSFPISRTGALASHYDALLLDLDGVVYVGHDAVPGVIDALNRAHDMFDVALTAVTNNAARSSAVVARHLQELGLTVTESDVVTSAQAAARELAKLLPAQSRVFVLGSRDLMSEVEKVGLIASQEFDDNYSALVQGYWPEMPWRMLGQASGILTNTECLWVATNMDLTIPTQWGTSPGNGTMVNALSVATGRQPLLVAGKPETPLMRESIERSNSQCPIVIGDRLDTDVLGASRVGIDSLLVFSGVSSIRDVLSADISMQPTFLGWTASAILEEYPTITLTSSSVQLGTWSFADGQLHGSGDALNAIRVVAHATWSGLCDVESGAIALSRLGLDVESPGIGR